MTLCTDKFPAPFRILGLALGFDPDLIRSKVSCSSSDPPFPHPTSGNCLFPL